MRYFRKEDIGKHTYILISKGTDKYLYCLSSLCVWHNFEDQLLKSQLMMDVWDDASSHTSFANSLFLCWHNLSPSCCHIPHLKKM